MSATTLLLALIAGVQAEPVKEPKKEPPPSLDGIWRLVRLEARGQELPFERLGRPDRYTLVIVDDAYVFSNHGGKVKFDAARGLVDLEITEGRYKGRALPGLFEHTDGVLRMALPSPSGVGRERPEELASDPQGRYALYVFEREDTLLEEQSPEARLKELRSALAKSVQAAPASREPVGRGTSDRTTQELLRQVIERLDRIEKRLDAMERKGAAPAKP